MGVGLGCFIPSRHIQSILKAARNLDREGKCRVKMIPWVEKYRPQTLDDLITRSERLTRQSFFPHLLLFGPPGTGKTSAILAVARTLYGQNYRKKTLELNASDDRGIQVVREQVKDCANSSSLIQSEVQFKLIILDECDNMTKDAQMSLRRVIEGSTKNVRFCLMCNHPNQLQPAIRSRCAQLRFPPLEPDIVKARLTAIIQKEEMEMSSDGLDALIKIGAGDLRHSLNTMQFLHMTGESIGASEVYRALGYPSALDIREVQHHLLNSSYQTAHSAISALCTNQGYALVDVIREVADDLMEQESLPQDVMGELVTRMADYEKRLTGAASEDLQLLAWIGSFIQARETLMRLAE